MLLCTVLLGTIVCFFGTELRPGRSQKKIIARFQGNLPVSAHTHTYTYTSTYTHMHIRTYMYAIITCIIIIEREGG